MSSDYKSIVSTLTKEKNAITRKVAAIDNERKKLIEELRRIERAIRALVGPDDSNVSPLTKDEVVDLVATKLGNIESMPFKSIRQKIAAELKSANRPRGGLTELLRFALEERASEENVDKKRPKSENDSDAAPV